MLLLQLSFLLPFIFAAKVDVCKGHIVYSSRFESFYLEGYTGTLYIPKKDQRDSVVMVFAEGRASRTYISVPKEITVRGGERIFIISPGKKGDVTKLKKFYQDIPPEEETFELFDGAIYREIQILSEKQRYSIPPDVFVRAISVFIALLIMVWLKGE